MLYSSDTHVLKRALGAMALLGKNVLARSHKILNDVVPYAAIVQIIA